MRIRSVFAVVAMLTTGLTSVASAPPAAADHVLPPLDASLIDYTPIGYYGPADEQIVAGSTTVPTPGDPPTGTPPGTFVDDPNPTGKFVAYDRNVWESLTLPSRHPGDDCTEVGGPLDQCREGDLDPDDDPSNYSRHDDGTSVVHGTCPPHPEFVPWGMCDNNQLEYLDYYENEMETEFADLGLIIKRYPFESPGGGTPRGTYLAAAGGQAYNIAAVIPGADHPEETVIVGAHYDFTDSGPAAAWDSAEGHTEIMRMAWIMADYYRKTGTRPSATIKFIPWDSEESGTHGSADYVANNIPPGEEAQVRGYFNVDPCAGAYPAFGEGPDATRQIDQVLQLANPASFDSAPEVKARIESFNATAEQVIDEVLEYLDDTLTRPGGTEVPIFVSDAEAEADGEGGLQSDRGKIVTALGGLFLFTSDYGNFQDEGIPIFNFFPDYFGPHADESPSDGGAKGLEILHTNNDNLQRINRLTSATTGTGAATAIDPLGNAASEGWAKGMEFCAQVEAWGMLQPSQAGAQTANTDVVSYFEALPNEAIQNEQVTFDATGTYQYSNVTSRAMETLPNRSFRWDFGDGTSGTGRVIQHAYPEVGRYNATLTVNGEGGSTDQMTIPITVEGSTFVGPVLDAIQPEDARDGNFELNWDFEASRDGFQHFQVEESFDYQALLADDASDIGANWDVAPPPPPGLEPWQHSDSETEKFLGNQFRSEPRSFWTGVTPENFTSFPLGGRSIMTLKNPIHIPDAGDPELGYWSLFRNQSVDSAQVQVAITGDGVAPEDLNWDVVDSFSDATNTCVGTNPTGVVAPEFEHRKVDLGRFAGKDILIRFVYILGATDPALSQPCGWYVDDIALFHGTFNPIAQTTEQQYVVLDRPNHTWAYRVKGVYNDGIATAPSNIEVAEVTESRDIPERDLRRCLGIQGKHILGSVGKDRLVGTDGPDVICGFAGRDKMKALGDDDVVLGFRGNDLAAGGAGRDRLLGDQANDKLKGGKGKDILKGGKGRDRLRGGGGNDRCSRSKKDDIKKC